MAYGEQFIARGHVAYTIHVWPTHELIAQSWTWSERWRAAYLEMAWAISLAAATQVLEGGTFAHREIEIETEIGRAKFTISQVGTTVHIVVSEFSGPNAPGPDGGVEAQPHAIDGLVIGLRGGANRSFHVVVFYGEEPSVPCINIIYSETSNELFYSMDRALLDPINIFMSPRQSTVNICDWAYSDWAELLLRELQTHLIADPVTHYDNPLDNVGVDLIGQTEAVRDGVGISDARLPVVGCSTEITHAIYSGMATMEDAYRINSPYRQNTRPRHFHPRLH